MTAKTEIIEEINKTLRAVYSNWWISDFDPWDIYLYYDMIIIDIPYSIAKEIPYDWLPEEVKKAVEKEDMSDDEIEALIEEAKMNVRIEFWDQMEKILSEYNAEYAGDVYDYPSQSWWRRYIIKT